VRNAERVESSIMKLGSLFSQMATMVAEQSETITRVEDDVEAGLMDTIEASKSMQDFYDVTKGNRGLILKVFALLIFFIFLFLWWT
jgi:syntaxin 5